MLAKVREASLYETFLTNNDGYDSFEEYVKMRDNESVDLIVGRGNKPQYDYPKLVPKRYVFSTGEYSSYQPFTVDITNSPDFVSSIVDVEKMKYFPDNSADDIYLERLWPPLYMNILVYIVAIRILKMYGTLVIDFNEAIMPRNKREQQLDKLRGALNLLGIPFEVKLINGKDDLKFYKRNDLGDDIGGRTENTGIACIKGGDVDTNRIFQNKKLIAKAGAMFGVWYSSNTSSY